MIKTINPITYASPATETVRVAPVQLICQSPEEGGIEDIDIEEWING